MNWYQIKSYLHYWSKAQTIYDIHSPFLYNFIQFVFDSDRTYYDFQLLKEICKMMAADKGELPISDVGTFSYLKGKKASITQLLKTVATMPSVSEQLYKINVYLQTENSLELGTCLGINSLYLAKSSKQQLVTIEGHPPYYNYARQLFQHTETENIDLKPGLFQEVIPELQDLKFDFIYIDGHHEYEATLQYTNQLYELLDDDGIMAIADNHWSKGMDKAWDELIKQEKYSLSMDCFHYGLLWKKVFPGPKQHFVYLPQAWLKPWKILKSI